MRDVQLGIVERHALLEVVSSRDELAKKDYGMPQRPMGFGEDSRNVVFEYLDQTRLADSRFPTQQDNLPLTFSDLCPPL